MPEAGIPVGAQEIMPRAQRPPPNAAVNRANRAWRPGPWGRDESGDMGDGGCGGTEWGVPGRDPSDRICESHDAIARVCETSADSDDFYPRCRQRLEVLEMAGLGPFRPVPPCKEWGSSHVCR
ncbi:hypothetical protein HAHE_20430 [Haloferula helveola]|uniref:Uncharacterized protein n=1 Tax=Haloferula helveola TaxID=490095 RepID=A0ABM7R9Y3_9BACT|nr:hypothetical protein HAHE_20430 [Haloferula helveola]